MVSGCTWRIPVCSNAVKNSLRRLADTYCGYVARSSDLPCAECCRGDKVPHTSFGSQLLKACVACMAV